MVDVAPGQLGRAVEELRQGLWTGLNVTVPHKEAVAALCDRLEETARQLGAVNTLVRTPEGGVQGYNTDLSGLRDALQGWQPGCPWRGQPVCVLGGGGAARAAVMAAYDLGASSVRLWNRTPERAHALVGELGVPARVVRSVREAVEGAALILQATSQGMGLACADPRWTEVEATAAQALRTASPGAVFMDLVYGREVTPWVSAARSRGLEAVDGVQMLLGQGVRAFALWTGREVSVEAMGKGLDPSWGRDGADKG